MYKTHVISHLKFNLWVGWLNGIQIDLICALYIFLAFKRCSGFQIEEIFTLPK